MRPAGLCSRAHRVDGSHPGNRAQDYVARTRLCSANKIVWREQDCVARNRRHGAASRAGPATTRGQLRRSEVRKNGSSLPSKVDPSLKATNLDARQSIFAESTLK